jgi:hypothetical protein
MCSSRKRFLCLDCKKDTGKLGEFYFISTELWLSIVGSVQGMLCIGCLEIRLGRKLNSKDFIECFINDPMFGQKSSRLMERLKS